MRKLFLLLWFVSSSLFGQVTWDFESNSLTEWEQSTAGRWEAGSQLPISGSYSLHHTFDNSISDHDQISIPIVDLRLDQGLTTWQFKVRHSYQPSSSNNWAIHLISDSKAQEMFPGASNNGYAVGVNYTGSDDILKLWKFVDGTITTLLETSINWQNEVPVDSTSAIKVTRTESGLWTVFFYASNSYNEMVEVGNIQSEGVIYPGNFGVYYEYSSSQDQKFWLDELSISGVFIKDTIAPQVEDLKIKSKNEVEIFFNEPILDPSLLDTLNFYLVNESLHPYSLSKTSNKSVRIKFRLEFINETNYNLEVSNIIDLSGNQQSEPLRREFFYYEVKPNSVLINEIMADPDPSVGLPGAEYLELLNNNGYEVCLDKWTITIGTQEKEIPEICIPANEHLILCSSMDTLKFSPYGQVTGIIGMPVLTNLGQDIILSDSLDRVISFISYNSDWYHDDFKKDGGWSIEQIDPAYPCIGFENWKASTDRNGGTPGQINSITKSNPDFLPPEAWKAYVVDDTIVEVHFNEPYNRDVAIQKELFSVDHAFDNPLYIRLLGPGFTKLQLVYTKAFKKGIIYTLLIENEFLDCAGNRIGEKDYLEFGIPEIIDSLDLVINEVLFNPRDVGVDFVEIYNRSDKILDAGELKIATRDDNSWELKSLCEVSSSPQLIMPNGYLVLTLEPQIVIDQYPASDPYSFIKLNDIPAYSNVEGNVVLLDKWFTIIDEFTYNEQMHFSLLHDVEGVSLERLNYDMTTMDASNWHSAAETVGYATPGIRNSQYTSDSESTADVWVEPEVFSPDNDGYNDFAQVFYDFGEPGYIASVVVFDSQGRKVRYLKNNELLGTSGSFLWDGENDSGEKASIGIYVFFIEVFNTRGEVKAYKQSCVLARKLN
ncbi:MAG: gliding motility-associated C-terminal domain-containing protein [Bacteroidales bacterium]|nr:gliding motility-associated C-terminal domain-containing protein [Bacteroidales bacterium]